MWARLPSQRYFIIHGYCMGKGSPRRQHVVGQGGLKSVKLPRFYHGCFSLPEGLMYQAQCLLLCKTPWLSFPITVSPCFVIRTQASAKWLWRDSRTSSGTDLCAVSGTGGGGQAGGWQTGFSVCRQSNLPDSSLIGEDTSWLQYIHDSVSWALVLLHFLSLFQSWWCQVMQWGLSAHQTFPAFSF